MFKSITAAIAITFLLAGCGGKTANVSYSEDIKPIIEENCVGCHNDQQELGGLNFSTYEKLMNSRYLNRQESLIIPGDAAQSRLYLVVHSTNDLIRMPPQNFGYDRLSNGDIESIKAWINEGAKNN